MIYKRIDTFRIYPTAIRLGMPQSCFCVYSDEKREKKGWGNTGIYIPDLLIRLAVVVKSREENDLHQE